MDNYMELKLQARPENEAFARNVVGAFCVSLSPTLEELNDIKTAVSEAVTNSVVHGYRKASEKLITVSAAISGSTVTVTISDEGVGIPNVGEALEPFYTTRPEEERSGMGFTIMQTFMDSLEVTSEGGTKVVMRKRIIGGSNA
jgi:anti-sigma F factor